ncbi:MAG: hypothetical protein FJX63_07420 [Alphaproteobacteria bacterium]|nr:hypothetical protein [Alphaproteobacteria bacterium]
MAEILHHNTQARRSISTYILAIAGAVLLVAGFAAERQICEGGDCTPDWLLWVARIAGGVLMLAGVASWWRNVEIGSVLDTEKHSLITWIGSRARDAKTIPLSSIATIRIRTGGDNDRLSLLDQDGKPLPFTAEAAPRPWSAWTKTIATHAPHIKIDSDE